MSENSKEWLDVAIVFIATVITCLCVSVICINFKHWKAAQNDIAAIKHAIAVQQIHKKGVRLCVTIGITDGNGIMSNIKGVNER